MRPDWYVVVSPENAAVEPVLDYGQGPVEKWRDVIYVYTRTAKRARVLALRWFRRRYTGRQRSKRYYLSDDSMSPFSGMTARRVPLRDREFLSLTEPKP